MALVERERCACGLEKHGPGGECLRCEPPEGRVVRRLGPRDWRVFVELPREHTDGRVWGVKAPGFKTVYAIGIDAQVPHRTLYAPPDNGGRVRYFIFYEGAIVEELSNGRVRVVAP